MNTALARLLLAGMVLPAWLGCDVAAAQDFGLHAYLDGRLVSAPAQSSWIDGGLGKTRFGDGRTGAVFGGAGLIGTVQATPALFGLAAVQVQGAGGHGVDVLEAYLRYRPLSLSRWRWSLQAGTFFPPVSLENDAIGWTSSWTLTSSAINSWVGEELRATGAETRLEWRGDTQDFTFGGSVFHRNDPTGTLLAVRGWSLSDLVYGLGSRVREPDAAVRDRGGQPPVSYDPFQNIGDRLGWYADLEWQVKGRGSMRLMHYDNRANPGAHTSGPGVRIFAWHTYFWSLGATARTGSISWIAQAIDGDTVIEPVDGLYRVTGFRSVFVLAGWNRGRWRPALRVEHFSTRDPRSSSGTSLGEHGNAVTAALNWRPRDWLRLTAEVLHIDSTRRQRVAAGLPPRSTDTQVQLGVRLIY